MVTHSERMKARRIKQLARTPGFTRVPNIRHEKQIVAISGVLAANYEEKGQKVDPVVIRWEAERELSRSLPALPVGKKLYITRPNRSKY